MRNHSAYLFGSGLGVAMLALVAGLQIPPVAASPQDPTIGVNRTLKGDRLPSVLPTTNGRPAELQGRQAPRTNPKLLDGCEAPVSAMTRSPLAQTAGRCIS
jgi:hypothetical protein